MLCQAASDYTYAQAGKSHHYRRRGFGDTSYPIEVGIALDDDTQYCSLILPAPGWDHWDDDEKKIHRIARAIPEAQVVAHLNQLFDGKSLHSDCRVVDKPWLTTLFHTARMNRHFTMTALETILSEQQMARRHETKGRTLDEVEQHRHRASFDAWIIQRTCNRALAESRA